jgi:virginiamycin B lyase
VRGKASIQRKPKSTGRVALLVLALAMLGSALCAALALAAGGPPIVSTTSVSEITETSATLEGQVNPHEREVNPVYFEYVDQAGFDVGGFTGASKTPAGTLPKGKDTLAISAAVSGLSPGTTYHYRIFAHNSLGDTVGPEHTFSTYVPAQAFGPCPNDAFRTSHPSVRLPDCRAYEQASPADKNGTDVTGTIYSAKASVGGDRVSFSAVAPIAGGEGAQEFKPRYLASRSGDAWSTMGLMPPQASGQNVLVNGWTPDFSETFAWARLAGEPNTTALFARSSADGSLKTIVPHTAGFSEPEISGASADGSVVLFESRGPSLIANAAAGKSNLYAWDRETGAVRLAGVLNTGQAPSGGAFAGSYDWVLGTNPGTLGEGGAEAAYYTADQHVVSADGSSVYFTAGETGQLYLRRNPTAEQSALDGQGNCTEAAKACTIQVSASRKTNGNGPGGTELGGPLPAAFQAATPDGDHAFFTSREGLTDDANTGPEPTEVVPPPAIVRANPDGTGIEPTFIPENASALAVDATYVYWGQPETNSIGRAKLDGTEVKPTFITGITNPVAVAVDTGHVYWVSGSDIGRANIDGTEVNPTFITDTATPQGVAVDAAHIYWTNETGASVGGGTIGRANIDGTGANRFFVDCKCGLFPRGIAVNANYIYETDRRGFIIRYDLDGTNEIESSNTELYRFRGIAVDAGHVYWAGEGSENRPSVVGRANLDLTEPEPEFIIGDRTRGVAADASHLYWTTSPENTSAKSGNDLYRYDAGSGDLTDMIPDAGDENGAEVLGVLGTSTDGSYVYLVANAVLAEGAGPGTCKHGNTELVSGACNLYLDHEGQLSFIARLDTAGRDSDDWDWKSRTGANNPNPKSSRVSADGRTLLFRSVEKLTAYANEGRGELYRYRVGQGINCVSCNPTEVATGNWEFESIQPPGQSSNPPAPTLSRNLSADGDRVFFESTEALVAADTNGNAGCPRNGNDILSFPTCQDVYEWEAPGSGSCEKGVAGYSAQDEGCLYLISDGTSTEPAFFLDASASGDDVFFFTHSQMVGQDKDPLQDVYDARVGGGLASQNEPPPPVPCEGEASCRPGTGSTSQAPQTTGTSTFSGPPSPKPHRHAKHRKRRHHKRPAHHRRPAHHNRRAHR